MPIHMRMRKLRAAAHEEVDALRAFRTHTQPVNISALDSRFDAGTEVTLELMKANGLATRKDIPVKVLAKGELSKALTVHAHAFSASAPPAHRGAPAAPARRSTVSRPSAPASGGPRLAIH